MSRSLTVVRAGLLTTVQDTGRVGLGHLAVPPSGALDQSALQLANRLVGNHETAAGLETTVDGVAVRFSVGGTIAVTGAPAEVTVGGRTARWGVPQRVPPGLTVEVGRATAGVRSYLAVGGGIVTTPALGSRSTDLLSGLGPPVLRAGDSLPLGEPTDASAGVDVVPHPGIPDVLRLRLESGPRDDWLSDGEWARLGSLPYTVAAASNRIAIRLDGPPLRLRYGAELPSEGIVTGAVQVPPDGRPLIFLADHPTTGGYPIIGVVDDAGLRQCAQARPGTPLWFRPLPS